MAAAPRSQRFKPNAVTEKIVPFVLVILLLALLAVFVILGLSMLGVYSPG